jgi:hypothetical protein
MYRIRVPIIKSLRRKGKLRRKQIVRCGRVCLFIPRVPHNLTYQLDNGKKAALCMGLCAPLEQSFGQGFGDVRVHNSPHASATAQAAGATAFASGRDVAFAAGRYDTRSFGRRFLLAHEMAHVAQMRSNPTNGAGLTRDTHFSIDICHLVDVGC